MNETFKFQPLSFSWVAIHPNPKGVIQFIGGAFFGSFPTVFYRYLLKALFDQGYTIIALPFRFTFRHWSVSISLLQEQKVLSQEISQIAKRLNYPTEVYQNLDNYFWIGHSLGCKYIALLELLSGDRWRDILRRCNSNADSQIRQIEQSFMDNPNLKRSIKDQPSLLIAPDISDTQSAIPRPLAFIARFLDSNNLGVIPTREQTLCYISKSPLFNLTGIISFDRDTIAGSEQDRFKDEEQRRNSDVLWLIEYLKQGNLPLLHQELSGKHLAPLGIQVGNYVIELNPLTKFIQRIQNRPLERVVIQFLDKLSMRVSRGTLTRKSLQLQTIKLPSPAARMAWLAEQLPNLPGSGIIYALTIKDTERVADWLNQQGIHAQAYHAALTHEQRLTLENQLLNNKIKALVATTALGMGFDKPDLGFVIHYQRPGSVVHYYQQVGRAGRAVEQAYGILLSGEEDQEITDYFIQTAFPPEAHVQEVLKALEQAEDGLSVPQIEQHLNLSNRQIQKVLKLLSLESPAPVTKQGSKWYATPVFYQPDTDKIQRLTQIRRQEQTRMLDYMNSRECLMTFLARELDDPQPMPCGKCAVCLGRSLLPETYSLNRVNQAIQYLRRSDQIIEPRKQWASKALPSYGFSGKIRDNLRAEPGRALSLWGDAGWGELVKQGKYHNHYFDDALVQGAFEMIQRWHPQPFPTWVTCVPSLHHPQLVPNFAQRLAHQLQLPFQPIVRKVHQNQPQKQMGNSYQQAHNLDGVFDVNSWQGMKGAVFLIDDIVDSRWTFTVIAALLRRAGSGPVFPLALALNSLA